jgi:hypothetical protein
MSELYGILIIIYLLYSGYKSLVKGVKPPTGTSGDGSAGPVAPQQPQLPQAARQPLAGPTNYVEPKLGQAQQRPMQPGEGGRQIAGSYGGVQPTPGQPQRRTMQPGEGGRQGGPQPNRGNADRTGRPAQLIGGGPQTVKSQAPMSDTALAFAKERKESDQVFADAAQEQRDSATTQELVSKQPPNQGIFMSGRFPLVDAIVLAQALGDPVCRRRFNNKRNLGHVIQP